MCLGIKYCTVPPQQKQHHVKGFVSLQASTHSSPPMLSAAWIASHISLGPSIMARLLPLGVLPNHRKLWSGPINAVRSRALVVPLTFPIPCWLSVCVYQRETEAPLKSLLLSVTFTEYHTVKDGMNACASYMALLTPVTKIMNDLLCHVSLPNGDHKSGEAVISANGCFRLTPAANVRGIRVVLFQSQGLKKATLLLFFSQFPQWRRFIY